MKLSVIIVNYNVRYFLEQALLSAEKAARPLDAEIFVVDNHSADDSVDMVRKRFPNVHLIANKNNPGFSKANNQAIRMSRGEYVLLLNPDTVVDGDSFLKCVRFMDEHPECGGLGVKMIDGSGVFLPESKRGFPSPFVAFCKTFGLSRLFPKSKCFNRYHLGYLNHDETHKVDVLSGAYMMLRKSVLDEVGLLDETFFMYGEDIDLSYRIMQAGYDNYYFADTTIIHYKGESTKRGSLNYVKVFYNAMIIFAKKHFSGSKGALFILMLQAAIYFRAGLTLLSHSIRQTALPILDAVSIGAGLFFIKDFWANYYHKNPAYYDEGLFLQTNLPIYVSVWLLSIFFCGGYDDTDSLRRPVRGLFFGTIILAAIYGFLPAEWRSSRMLIVMGAFWSFLAVLGSRLLLHFLQYRNFKIGKKTANNLAIVGQGEELRRSLRLLQKAGVEKNIIGSIAVDADKKDDSTLGHFSQLDDLARIYKINEIIFCSKDVPPHDIMSAMTRLGSDIQYKILPEKSISIIGSQSKKESGELYTVAVKYLINQKTNIRNKRLLDILLSLLFLLASPILCLLVRNGRGFLLNIFAVLWGGKTWVGYSRSAHTDWTLPPLPHSVLHPKDAFSEHITEAETLHRMDFFYAKDYTPSEDLNILLGGWRELGRE